MLTVACTLGSESDNNNVVPSTTKDISSSKGRSEVVTVCVWLVVRVCDDDWVTVLLRVPEGVDESDADDVPLEVPDCVAVCVCDKDCDCDAEVVKLAD